MIGGDKEISENKITCFVRHCQGAQALCPDSVAFSFQEFSSAVLTLVD